MAASAEIILFYVRGVKLLTGEIVLLHLVLSCVCYCAFKFKSNIL